MTKAQMECCLRIKRMKLMQKIGSKYLHIRLKWQKKSSNTVISNHNSGYNGLYQNKINDPLCYFCQIEEE